MRRMLLLTFAALMLLPDSALAARTIDWDTRASTALAKARRSDQPIMFWCFGRRRDRNQELEDDQVRAFTDERVLELSERFVNCRMNVDAEVDFLESIEMQPGPHLNQTVFFTDPNGVQLSTLNARQVAQPAVLARAMEQARDTYHDRVLARLMPVFENENATSEQLGAVVKTVADMGIEKAEAPVIALLEREKLDEGLRRDIYKLLGEFGTAEGARALFYEIVKQERQLSRYAERELDDMPLTTVESIFEFLGADDQKVKFTAYEVITDIARVRRARSTNVLEKMSAAEVEEEFRRAFDEAREAVQEYRQEQAERERRERELRERQRREDNRRYRYGERDYDGR